MRYLVLLAPIFSIANNAFANSEKENANLTQRTLKSTVIIESTLKTGEAICPFVVKVTPGMPNT